MLKELKSFGVRKKYFEIGPVCEFRKADGGTVHIKTEAIDFDETKRVWCAEKKKKESESCDALDIVHSKNRVNFIEFKPLKKIRMGERLRKAHEQLRSSLVLLRRSRRKAAQIMPKK